MSPAVGAVVFDLDDTLYLQATWLTGAWQAVAAAAPVEHGAALHGALVAIAAEGSDKGRVIDRAIERVGVPLGVEPLLAAFRSHRPAALPLIPGAADAIRSVRERVPVALVTDGDPIIQRSKIAALGLDDAFDAFVLSDELGREHRKPDPAPFVAAAAALGVDPGSCASIGDRPAKDVVGAVAAGYACCVRVRTGEHNAAPDEPCLAVVDDVGDAVRVLAPLLTGIRSPRRGERRAAGTAPR